MLRRKRYAFPLIIIVLLAVACSKTPDEAIIQPPIDPSPLSNESIAITNASKDHFYPLLGGVSFDAKIEGDKTDYSFLKAYLIDTLTKQKLAETNVTADGSIHFAFSLDRADKYQTQIVAQSILDTSEQIESPDFGIYAGEPPPLDTVHLDKTDKAITITWSRSTVPNFLAYEVYVLRTDTAGILYDTSRGKLLTTITNINDTSLIHDDIFFYYRYGYSVRVVTDENFGSATGLAVISAGIFVDGLPPIALNNFDETKNLYYTILRKDETHQVLVSIDPETHEVEELMPVGTNLLFYSLAENDAYLNIATKTDVGLYNYLLSKFNLDTKVLGEPIPFAFGTGQINAIFDNYVIFHAMYAQPPYSFMASHYVPTQENKAFRKLSLPIVSSINHNTGFFLGSQDPNVRDSFYVYNMTADGPALKASGLVHNTVYSETVYSGNNVVCVGGSYFDGDLNLINTLPGTLVYRGVSRDGKYAVVSDNSVRRLSDGVVVHQFGDGFPGTSYFSADNKSLYFLTDSRMYRYKWDE